MNYFQDYTYGLTKITAVAKDNTSGNYLWIAFSKNSAGNCLLKKVSANNLYQVYYTIAVPCQNINCLLVANGFIYVGVVPLISGPNTNAFIFSYSLANPLTLGYITFRYSGASALVSVEENTIALVYDGTSFIYALTPGIISGEVAMIVQYIPANTFMAPTFNDLIPLEVSAVYVRQASTITIDSSDNLWVATNTSPANLIRVWNPGSGWQIEETTLS